MTRQPIVGIFRERRDIDQFIFKAPHYQQAYHEIIDQLNEKGVYVAVLMGQGSYLGHGRFAKHWAQTNRNGVYAFEPRGPITVDMVFEKDLFKGDGRVYVLNPPTLRDLCRDKHASYDLLREFYPKSAMAANHDELSTILATMPGEMVALKTLQGNSGEGVFVGTKNDALRHSLNYPVQVQEFVETSGGIPDITTKRHDLRVVMVNGAPILCTLRTPPAGGLKSNLGYGGETELIPLDDLPLTLREVCSTIDKRLADLAPHRLYSADFGLTPKGWRLFEINAMPGTVNRARGEPALHYQDQLTDFLKQVALKHTKGD